MVRKPANPCFPAASATRQQTTPIHHSHPTTHHASPPHNRCHDHHLRNSLHRYWWSSRLCRLPGRLLYHRHGLLRSRWSHFRDGLGSHCSSRYSSLQCCSGNMLCCLCCCCVWANTLSQLTRSYRRIQELAYQVPADRLPHILFSSPSHASLQIFCHLF